MARTVILARIALHQLSGGYKGYTIVSGLHPLFRFGETLSSGRIVFIDVPSLHQGEEAMAIIDFLECVGTDDNLSPGSEIRIQDGANVIGVAVICEIVTV